MPKLDSLGPLMIDELRDLLDAEKQITKALPKMARAASADELKSAFTEHLQQTNRQVERLGQVFESLGEKPRGKKCVGIQGLIEEGEEMMREAAEGPTRDAVLIAAAQKVEHYEMAAYGTARTYASLLGHHDAADLLERTLEEEKMTDQRLTGIAESVSNPGAAGAGRVGRRQAMQGSTRSSAEDRGRGGSGGRGGSHARGRRAGSNASRRRKA